MDRQTSCRRQALSASAENQKVTSSAPVYVAENIVSHAVYGHPDLPIVYLNNPKAACSTLKASLWRHADKLHNKTTLQLGRPLHSKNGYPFVEDIHKCSTNDQTTMLEKPFFTVVRNPFSRILASYHHKILGADPKIFQWFCDRFQLDEKKVNGQSMPLKTFLHLVTFDHPMLVNIHFRPQYINTLSQVAEFDFVGNVENMSLTSEYLANHGIDVVRANMSDKDRGHVDSLTKDCGPGERALIRDYYNHDFSTFGYDPGGPTSAGPKPTEHIQKSNLARWLSGAFDFSIMAPELSFWRSFSAAKTKKRKMELAVEADISHRHRGVLHSLFRFFSEAGEKKRAERVKSHLDYCLTGHMQFIDDKSIIRSS